MKIMNLKEKQMNEAADRMLFLGIHTKYVSKLKNERIVACSDCGDDIGPWMGDPTLVRKDSCLYDIIRDIERETGILVYHVIRSIFMNKDMYSFLFVSSEENEWDDDRNDIFDLKSFVYVTWSGYAGFGYIGIQPIVGGVSKTWLMV